MLDGNTLKAAFISGAANITNQKNSIDELNVYPVPDGDTGMNMSMTMNNAAKQLQVLENDSTVSKVADVIASALLRGARGNSGVILSLLFRGFSKGLSGLKTATTENIANALELGVQAAYKAVMQPTEGTILTVARMAGLRAKAVAKTETNIAVFWEEMLKEAEIALANTPNLLEQLKKAGVVDAGGKGLCVIFEGMGEVFKGNSPVSNAEKTATHNTIDTPKTAVGDFDEEINFTYCTEFIVNKKNENQDPAALRAYLETIGDCVVVVDDDEIIKVHVHTDHPGNAFEKALTIGSLTNMKIENMREQHSNKVIEAQIIRETNTKPVEAVKKYGFVAVCAGKGIANLFNDLGVDVIVSGGQTMNPSTDDILKAIHNTPSEIVYVLPNNKNIIMAAEQAVNLANKEVVVVPTKTIPQGLNAMLDFDETQDKNVNLKLMTKALERVTSGSLTYAARDSELDGKAIKKGEILALEDGKFLFTGTDVTKTAYKLIRKLVKSDSSFITIIYGADVLDDTAKYLKNAVEKKYGGKMDVQLISGNQPVYYYIISIE